MWSFAELQCALVRRRLLGLLEHKYVTLLLLEWVSPLGSTEDEKLHWWSFEELDGRIVNMQSWPKRSIFRMGTQNIWASEDVDLFSGCAGEAYRSAFTAFGKVDFNPST